MLSIAKTRDRNQAVNPCSVAVQTRSINSLIVYTDDNKVIRVVKCSILDSEIKMLNLTHITDKLFDDKLRDMKGYSYSAILNLNDKSIKSSQGKVHSLETNLMETIARKQNAKLKITQQLVTVENISTISSNLSQGQVDMLLNFGCLHGFEKFNQKVELVNTFETNGYCALIPIPPALPFMVLVIGILDNTIRTLLIGSIFIAAVVWKIFKVKENYKFESAGYFAFKIVCIFFGHLSPFRRNRHVLVIMVQCFVFPLIFLGNMYESYMFSILVDQGRYTKLNNFDEVMNGDYKVHADILFATLAHKSDYDTELTTRLENTVLDGTLKHMHLMTENENNVLIVNCEDSSDLLELEIDSTIKGKDIYYELSEKLFTNYENILLSRKSPFLNRLNELSLRIHESGIKQHWKMLMKEIKGAKGDYVEDQNIFTMKEMLGAVKIYFIAIGLASTSFILEVLWTFGIKSYLRIVSYWMFRKIRKFYQDSKGMSTRRVHEPKVRVISLQQKPEKNNEAIA